MEYNVKKCKVMHIGHGNTRQVYTMKGQVLDTINEETDVGVRVADTLKPGAQCRKAAKTAQTVLSQITRAFHYRDRHTFMPLYKQYLRPHLEFAAPAWSPWTRNDIDCLEKVQKRAVSMVSGLAGHDYEDRLQELGLDTLEERRLHIDMTQVYKVLNGKDKVSSDTWFASVAARERATRAAADPMNLRVPAPRLEVRKHFFTQRVPAEWNRIPAALKSAATVAAFKRGYRAFRKEELAGAQRGRGAS